MKEKYKYWPCLCTYPLIPLISLNEQNVKVGLHRVYAVKYCVHLFTADGILRKIKCKG